MTARPSTGSPAPPPPRHSESWRAVKRRYERHDTVVLGILGVVLLFAAWEALPRVFGINPVVLPPPSRIVQVLAGLVQERGELATDLVASSRAFVVAFGLACAVGVTLGAAMGRLRAVEYLADPYVWLLYSTPLISIYPLLIVWFGLGFSTVVALAFLLAVVPIVINTNEGFKATGPELLRVGRSLGLGPLQVVLKIRIPAALPMIFAGLRVASGRAVTGVVIGEMFGANAGLGYRITVYSGRVRLAEVFAYLLVVVAFGLVATQVVRLGEDRVLAWRKT